MKMDMEANVLLMWMMTFCLGSDPLMWSSH